MSIAFYPTRSSMVAAANGYDSTRAGSPSEPPRTLVGRPYRRAAAAARARAPVRHTVPSTTLGRLMAEYASAEPVELLKVDCEGCETELLSELNATRDLTRRIWRIAGELHGCGYWVTVRLAAIPGQTHICLARLRPHTRQGTHTRARTEARQNTTGT